MGRALAVYTGLRLLLFVASYAVLLAVGAGGPLGVVGSLLVSSVVSLLVLRRQRDALATALAERRERRTAEKARLRSLLDDGPVR